MKLPLLTVFLFFMPGDGLHLTAQNTEESKVPEFVLPPVMTTGSNHQITNINEWENIRRPELLTLFESQVYGEMPHHFDSIHYRLVNKNNSAMSGQATLHQVVIRVFNEQQSVSINLVVFIPNHRKKPAPVFLLINNRGLDNMDPTRNQQTDFWPAELIVKSGYAAAVFQVNDLAPDNPVTYAQGALKLYPGQLKKPTGMKAIGAWAWGASRIMDYFATASEIDADKVIIAGHSRGGKAALWAAARDQRFAICISNCSGNTGAALSRRRFGETVAAINTKFPHWFNDNYKKYNHREDLLPIDQHLLIALLAPRPVYVTSASQDLWADPKGSYLALQHAAPAYLLYSMTSKLPKAMPSVNTAFTTPPLGYHNREGRHDLTNYDWQQFIKFCDRHFGKNAR